MERGLESARLPIGVATTYSVPRAGSKFVVNLGRRKFVKTAMNRAAERAKRAELGVRAEELCAELLRKSGLRVLARNWRCRHGEIDLVAEEGGTLVFAEVRYRRDERYGGAAGSVTPAKQARLIAAARLYLLRGRASRPEPVCRFDVLLLDSLETERIRWIRNAFTA